MFGLLFCFINVVPQYRAHLLAYQLKGKTPSQQMIEELLCFGSGLRPAAQANAFADRLIDHFAFRRRFENLIQGGIDCGFIDLLHSEIAFQSLSSDRSLLDAQRCITMRVTSVVQIAILKQTRDHLFDDWSRCATAFQQTFLEFLD